MRMQLIQENERGDVQSWTHEIGRTLKTLSVLTTITIYWAKRRSRRTIDVVERCQFPQQDTQLLLFLAP